MASCMHRPTLEALGHLLVSLGRQCWGAGDGAEALSHWHLHSLDAEVPRLGVSKLGLRPNPAPHPHPL